MLRIDQRRVMLKRVLDMNDRALRKAPSSVWAGKADGIPRSDSFQITVASEGMAILCLASNLADLKERLGKILVAYDLDGNPVYAKDLGANGAIDSSAERCTEAESGTDSGTHAGTDPWRPVRQYCPRL